MQIVGSDRYGGVGNIQIITRVCTKQQKCNTLWRKTNVKRLLCSPEFLIGCEACPYKIFGVIRYLGSSGVAGRRKLNLENWTELNGRRERRIYVSMHVMWSVSAGFSRRDEKSDNKDNSLTVNILVSSHQISQTGHAYAVLTCVALRMIPSDRTLSWLFPSPKGRFPNNILATK